MKPTISNAFNQEPLPVSNLWKGRLGGLDSDDALTPVENGAQNTTIAAMEVDLRETNFGWSLDLTPMHAADALQALRPTTGDPANLQFLVTLDQSTWLDGHESVSIREIARRMAISLIAEFGPDHVVMSQEGVRQLVALCRPTRLMVVAVEGEIDDRDVMAITRALDTGISPLIAELRAVAAIEVLGDRAVMLHCRSKSVALTMIAENFRHYMAAVTNGELNTIEPPYNWQLERLMTETGLLTIRPVETQVFSTAVDVGINTTKERFTRPADRSLIYDIHSDSWHDEA